MENKNSEEIIVKFDQVTKKYGDLVVLDKLNLDIKNSIHILTSKDVLYNFDLRNPLFLLLFNLEKKSSTYDSYFPVNYIFSIIYFLI